MDVLLVYLLTVLSMFSVYGRYEASLSLSILCHVGGFRNLPSHHLNYSWHRIRNDILIVEESIIPFFLISFELCVVHHVEDHLFSLSGKVFSHASRTHQQAFFRFKAPKR